MLIGNAPLFGLLLKLETKKEEVPLVESNFVILGRNSQMSNQYYVKTLALSTKIERKLNRPSISAKLNENFIGVKIFRPAQQKRNFPTPHTTLAEFRGRNSQFACPDSVPGQSMTLMRVKRFNQAESSLRQESFLRRIWQLSASELKGKTQTEFQRESEAEPEPGRNAIR